MDVVSQTSSATGSIKDKRLVEFPDEINPADKNWKYIEFRCMIQDILGNEIYSRNDSTKLCDRTIFYCITIPGENDWVGRATSVEDGLNNFEVNNSAGDCDQERLSISLVNYSFPIPDGKNKSCLIKVYDVNLVDCLRVNDIVQVGGYVEPIEFEDDAKLLTNKNSPKSETESNNTSGTSINKHAANTNGNPTNIARSGSVDTDNYGDISEMAGHKDFEPAMDFPERLVPRIHVQTLRKLPHINPLLPQVLDFTSLDVNRLKMARARLTTILSQLLGGDLLATEYLIFSLISRIYERRDVTILGQFSLCLCGFKPEMRFLVEKLYEMFSKITTHSHYIDLSIANLNNLRFTPEKDVENNKMIAGTLQLPDGLFLMLNETALSEGLLTAQGTSNVNILKQIVQWQKHKYNFKYHSVEIDTDLKILVMAEGKSLLPIPFTVRLENTDSESIENMRQACGAVDDFLTEDLLNMFRYYITSMMNVPDYRIPEAVTTSIKEDFVAWRQEDKKNNKTLFSMDDLSHRMTLARYMTISHCKTSLTQDIWKEVCRLEEARLARLKLIT